MEPETTCELLAAGQHGVISRRQALAAGMNRGSIERRVGAGRWRILHPGVYVLRPVPVSWHQRLMAAVLWGGPHAAASHRAAAVLWKLDGIEERVVEISIQSGRRTQGVVVHRRQRTDVPFTVRKDGIPTTCMERTILDLAGIVSHRRAGLALDDALRRGLSLEQITEAAEILGRRGRSGMASVDRLVAVRDHRDGRTESRLESALLQLIRAYGLPSPTPQYRVIEEGVTVARLDFAYPLWRIGLEADGHRWHGGRERWARDIRRENRLKLLGWTVLRFSWEDVFERPELVAAQIRSVLAVRVRNLS